MPTVSTRLTRDTPIPTSIRGKVRALVKAHKEWRLFLEAKDIISADAKNRDLLEFALFHPTLVTQIELLVSPEAAKQPKEQLLATGQEPTLAEQIAQIERLLHEFFQRNPQRKPRIRVQAVTEDA